MSSNIKNPGVERQTADATPADDLLVLAAKMRSKLGDADLSTDCLYDPKTGLPAAREEARWAVAAEIAGEVAAEAGVTPEDREWAAHVLGLDTDGRL